MGYKTVDRITDLFASVTSVGDVVLDIFNVVAIKKQNRNNRNLIIGTHIALSALAVGVSMYQTKSIKNTIKGYRKENRHWG